VQPTNEVRTRSVPTAAHLVLLGFKVVRVIRRESGGSLLVFPPEAQDALNKFAAVKMEIDGLLFEPDDGAR
jgi:hypothetical protein